MALFKIYAALNEDVNQGWIWLHASQLPSGSPQRSIVKLSAIDKSKHIYCETRTLDENFITRYNESPHTIKIDKPESALVAAEWYQIHLGIENVTNAEIKVTLVNHYYGSVKACLDHPQVVVRLATKLGLLGVLLGIIAIIPIVKDAICTVNLILGGCGMSH